MMAANKQTQSSRSFFHRGTITTALVWLLCLMTLSLHTLTTTRTHGFVVLPSTTCGRRIGASVASTPTASSPSQQQQPPPVSPSHTTAMAMVRKKKQQPLGSIDEDDKSTTLNANRQRKQQLGAVAVVVVGVVYDFCITHQGVGFWDPNYVV